MSRRLKIKERLRRRRELRKLCILGGVLATVMLLVVICIAIWDYSPNEIKSPISMQEKEVVVCDKFSRFSGQYVEDGNDIPVENVAAILVTNQSERFLDLAIVKYKIDGRDATFVATGLPAGKSAWVMEENRMTVTDASDFKYVDQTTAYKDGTTASTDKIKLSVEGNMMTALNTTDEKLEGVFVYYKTLHTDGNYFGGITYMVDFGDLEPGGKLTKLAGHYDRDKTEIVRIRWKTEE